MRSTVRRAGLLALLCFLAAAVAAPTAHAGRTLLLEAALDTDQCARCGGSGESTLPPPEGQIEGPCGLAISPANRLYVADYHHRVVDIFGLPTPAGQGSYMSQIVLSGTNPVFGVNTLDSVCGLAFDSAGNLYGNEWHQGVVRLTGGEATIDSGESTGVAIDPSIDRLFVDDRTYVAEYALPYVPGAEPVATIGGDSLGEGYGVAASGGRLYVADAADQTVKVFEPATSETEPVATISGSFVSLTNAALAIDPTNGHLLVVDNPQPGFEHPRSGVLEFDSAGNDYAFLGRLPGAPVDGGPSGIVVGPSGQVIVTDGNGELSNAFLYGPFEAEASFAGFGSAAAASTGLSGATSAGVGGAFGTSAAEGSRRRGAAASEVSQSGGVRVSFQGKLTPRTLPRRSRRPVVASVGAKVVPLGGRTPPQLRRIEIAINRNGHFAPGAVPSCRIEQIQPATTPAALAACRPALVGEGHFSARVLLPSQAPFPSSGKVYAFNGRWHGHSAILAHVYGTEPAPTSFTLPFVISHSKGTFGTTLTAKLPADAANAVTGIELDLQRRYTYRGKAKSYASASCPAPKGFHSAVFSFARASYRFVGGKGLAKTLSRVCRAAGDS